MQNLRRRPGDEDEEWRASSAELFFDLVFVLVVTQLSALLYSDLTISGATETLFLLLVGWWAWIYTTWATNWFDPDRGPMRALLVLLMLASMLGAAAMPDAFGERALLIYFIDERDGRGKVLYVRRDGDYGLVEPPPVVPAAS
jgi:low temperature requirement protein LtrA